jgi:uncharacterized membrane protein
MSGSFNVWLEYLLRFSHVVAGIAWIGSSFYFIWLDSSFMPPGSPRRNVEGESFMVHGGFYYLVEKRKIYPGELPPVLHWFKWEATLTWITGFLLLTVLYFLNGASLLVDPSKLALSQGQAVGLALAIIAASWLVYDLVWHPRWMKSQALSTALSAVLGAGLIYGLTRVFSGRGAFILTGATFGTMMLLNVWIRILPGQAKMLKAAQAGEVPDYSVSLKSKTRSVHNTYFIFPVIFIMLSNHYPSIYQHPMNWLLLIILSVSGALTRHAMVTKKAVERWTLAPAAMGLLALVFMTTVPAAPELASARFANVSYEQVHEVIQARCLRCHASNPTDDVYKTPPKGVVLETESQVRGLADRIYFMAVQNPIMPLGNKTGMTTDERAMLGSWLKKQGLVR